MQKFKMQEKKDADKEKKNARGPGGRPLNTDKPQEVQRETKPQGMAMILEYEKAKNIAIPHVLAVEKVVAKCVLKSLGKKNLRSLTKHEAKGIEEITFAVASQTLGEKITDGSVLKVLASNPVIGGKVYELYQDMQTPDMCKADRMYAIASAIALYKVQGD
jgi:hypothetical protein